MLDQAFEALKTYDWGQDRKVLKSIDEAVVAAHGDDASRAELEKRLAEVLTTDVSHDSKQFVCRKLMRIGTAASVPTLAGLLSDPKLSHMARYALERIPAAEAGNALRDALSKVKDDQKIGVIASLGVRGEAASVEPLKRLLNDGNPAVAQAAAHALGAIRSSEAAKALTAAKVTDETKAAVADASLACAESILAEGNSAGALTIYKQLLTGNPTQHIKVAATRGMLACAGKKQ
jgi:HEAT repeat protein